MSILEKRHDRPLHYADLHNFGEPAVIQPYDIVNDLNKYLPSGNHKVNGYTAYKMLIGSQMEEAQRRAISFKPQVVNADKMTEAQLLGKCQKVARSFVTDCRNVLKVMEEKNPYRIFSRQRVETTESRRLNREKEQGQKMLRNV